MALELSELGERIARARREAGLTQRQLSAAIGMERSALAKIEKGIRGVAALELVAMAEALDQRIEWLVCSPTPSLVSHRLRAGEDQDIATIDRELETLSRDIELVTELEPDLMPTINPEFAVPQSQEEAEGLAASVRTLAGLNTFEQVADLVGVCARLGMMGFSSELGNDAPDAGTLLLERGGVALVNSSNNVGRRRLSLAHELGHYLVADDYTVDWRVASYSDSDRVEAAMDRFARAFLAPEQGLGKIWNDAVAGGNVHDGAVRTASHFRIDMSTLARRLADLRLADSDTIAEVRKVRTTRSDIIEFGLVVPTELEGTSVPRHYAKVVLRLYRQGRISSERTLELLCGMLQEDDLPERPIAHPDEIWGLIG